LAPTPHVADAGAAKNEDAKAIVIAERKANFGSLLRGAAGIELI
jgi:hypothetical protein